jgi:hypothetical protein
MNNQNPLDFIFIDETEKDDVDGPTLFELLTDRELVVTDSDVQLLVTWNRSQTFQIWEPIKNTHKFKELEIRTVSNEPENFENAKERGLKFLKDYIGGV